MSDAALPLSHLFAPIALGSTQVRNRIVFTAHHTHLSEEVPSERLAAYYEARAKGGAGLIIVEVAGVHSSAQFASHMIMATDDACIPGYRAIAERCHAHGAAVFGQLFHPGRETRGKIDGVTPVAFAPSALPGERHHVMPRALPGRLIKEIVVGHGESARRMCAAGLDGVEVLASHGYLLAQFLSPRTNQRTDQYGGSFDNRLRIVREILHSIREQIGDLTLGIRLSAAALSPEGASDDEMSDVCKALNDDDVVDYFSLVLGSSSTLGGSTHIVPPMEHATAYVLPTTSRIKLAVLKPVIVTGRINQPQMAEQILKDGQADLCGMTRAMIADPLMPDKARARRLDDIRACIACNQACSGHGLHGFPISCIQYPESGRELEFSRKPAAKKPRRVMVVGGGPAGLKAASVAAERGHRVTLYERESQVGGQVLLAQRLPSRTEFGGLATTLLRECELAGVEIVTGIDVTAPMIRRMAPDALILATGGVPFIPEIEGAADAQVLTAWQVLKGEANVGASVVVADSKGDWIGPALAELLAAAGSRVRLCVSAPNPADTIQQYVRDLLVARAHSLGVEFIPYARLFGVDADTVYFQHTVSGEPMLCEDVNTLVLALGNQPVSALEDQLGDFSGALYLAGDCLSPRTAEEAVYEGLKAAMAV